MGENKCLTESGERGADSAESYPHLPCRLGVCRDLCEGVGVEGHLQPRSMSI